MNIKLMRELRHAKECVRADLPRDFNLIEAAERAAAPSKRQHFSGTFL